MQRDYRSVLTNFKSDDATTHTESSNFCLFSCSCQDMTKLALLLLTTIRSLALIGGVWNSTLMIKPHSKFLKTLIPILFSMFRSSHFLFLVFGHFWWHDKTCLVVIKDHQINGLDWQCVELYTHDKITLQVFLKSLIPILFSNHISALYYLFRETAW